MADLHSDMIEQGILPHLPFKSVVRWMCTSWFWYRKIRSSEFSKKYLKKSTDHNTDRCLILSTVGSEPTEFFWLAFDDNDNKMGHERRIDQPLYHLTKQTKVVGHSNGLVCICNHNCPGTMGKIDEVELAIWNPSIRRFKRVPILPGFTVLTDDKDVLQYTPSYGFGYNPKVDDYEIVQISQCRSVRTRTFTSEVRIYTLGTNEWRRNPDLDAKYNRLEVARGHFEGKTFSCPLVNGHMHWLMRNFSADSWKILAFDIENGEFVDYGFPFALDTFREVQLHGLGDHLYLLENQEYWLDVWRMNEYKNGQSWAKIYCSSPNPEWSISLFPLLNSKIDHGILNLANNAESFLFWLELKDFQMNIVHYFPKDTAFRGNSFVQNFLLDDGEPVPLQ